MPRTQGEAVLTHGPVNAPRRSRCVGAVSAVSLGTAVERGGTIIAAPGKRSAPAVQTPSWS